MGVGWPYGPGKNCGEKYKKKTLNNIFLIYLFPLYTWFPYSFLCVGYLMGWLPSVEGYNYFIIVGVLPNSLL